MHNRIVSFIFDQVNKIREGRLPILFQKCFLLLTMPLSLLAVLLVRLLRPFILIRFGRLESSRLGHFAANTEVYLCERDLGIHGQRSLDIFYVDIPICNRQLKKMWSRILCISFFARGLDLINRVLPGGDKHEIRWLNRDRDVLGTFESTKPHISFTDEEERIGQSLLSKLGIADESPFVCFLSRNAAYLDTVFRKGNWCYHDYRDSNIKNFIPAAEQLTQRGYFALRMGAVVKEPLESANYKIIDYATKHRSEFLDIFLGAKCHFYLGDPCGFSTVPMIFRRPLAIVNMIPLEWTPTWGQKDLFIPKKLWLREERRLLTFREIFSLGIGRFLHSQQYEQLKIEPIENTPKEIADLAVEMDQRLKGEWQSHEEDEDLQRRFWALFKPSELSKVFQSRIGAEFLRQNKELLG